MRALFRWRSRLLKCRQQNSNRQSPRCLVMNTVSARRIACWISGAVAVSMHLSIHSSCPSDRYAPKSKIVNMSSSECLSSLSPQRTLFSRKKMKMRSTMTTIWTMMAKTTSSNQSRPWISAHVSVQSLHPLSHIKIKFQQLLQSLKQIISNNIYSGIITISAALEILNRRFSCLICLANAIEMRLKGYRIMHLSWINFRRLLEAAAVTRCFRRELYK